MPSAVESSTELSPPVAWGNRKDPGKHPGKAVSIGKLGFPPLTLIGGGNMKKQKSVVDRWACRPVPSSPEVFTPPLWGPPTRSSPVFRLQRQVNLDRERSFVFSHGFPLLFCAILWPISSLKISFVLNPLDLDGKGPLPKQNCRCVKHQPFQASKANF